MRLIAALGVLTLASGAAAQSNGWRLTPEGYGAVQIGMTRPQVERVLGTRLQGEAIEDAAACIEMGARTGHPGLVFMFEDNRLTRVSAGQRSRAQTPRGIGVGATEAQVRRAYGSGLQSEPHKYQGGRARYLTYWTRPSVRGVVFETNERGRVQVIHAGTASIQYVEGCA